MNMNINAFNTIFNRIKAKVAARNSQTSHKMRDVPIEDIPEEQEEHPESDDAGDYASYEHAVSAAQQILSKSR